MIDSTTYLFSVSQKFWTSFVTMATDLVSQSPGEDSVAFQSHLAPFRKCWSFQFTSHVTSLKLSQNNILQLFELFSIIRKSRCGFHFEVLSTLFKCQLLKIWVKLVRSTIFPLTLFLFFSSLISNIFLLTMMKSEKKRQISLLD